MLTLVKIKDPKGHSNGVFYFFQICFNLLYECILHVTITLFADKYPFNVQNIKHGSKLYVNIDIAKIQEFHNRYNAYVFWNTQI